MEYIAPRTMTVVCLSGRSVAFTKNIPTYAPPQMHATLISMGVVPAEPADEAETNSGPAEPQVPAEREAALFAAFDAVALRAKREEFTAVGVPHLAVLAKDLGWSVGGKERDVAWAKYTLDKSGI